MSAFSNIYVRPCAVMYYSRREPGGIYTGSVDFACEFMLSRDQSVPEDFDENSGFSGTFSSYFTLIDKDSAAAFTDSSFEFDDDDCYEHFFAAAGIDGEALRQYIMSGPLEPMLRRYIDKDTIQSLPVEHADSSFAPGSGQPSKSGAGLIGVEPEPFQPLEDFLKQRN